MKTKAYNYLMLCMLSFFCLSCGGKSYNWNKHNDFKIFYEDFKKAVNSQDKEAVFKMTNMPFVCNLLECSEEEVNNAGGGVGYDPKYDLNVKDKDEFMKKYDLLFPPSRIKDINKGVIVSLDLFGPDDEYAKGFYKEKEMVLKSDYELHGLNIIDIDFFSFMPDAQGMYKLNNIPRR